MIRARATAVALAAIAVSGSGLLGAPVATATPPANGLVHIGQAAVIPDALTALGAMAPDSQLQAEVILQPNDPAALTQFVSDVSTPGSPSYHQYLGAGAFAARFGASAATLTSVTSELRDLGLVPGMPDPDGLFIPVSGDAATFERALHVAFHRYRFADGRNAYANTTAPELPASIARSVRAIVGLDDLALPVPADGTAGLTTPAAQNSGAAVPATSGPTPCPSAPTSGSAYDAPKLAQAYSFANLYSGNDLGAGITIGLYELERSTTFLADTTAFKSCYGITSSVTYELVDNPPAPSSISTVGQETQLDVDTVLEMAPKANVIVYQGPNSGTGPIDTYRRMVNDDTARVISTSWGECEYDLGYSGSAGAQAESLIFQQAAAQGQTVVAASGDQGSEGCNYGSGNTSDPDPTGDLQVLDPASQPDVTGVGGTSLTNVATNPPAETTWDNIYSSSGSTGGISEFWPMPSYQSGALSSLNVINANSSGTQCANTGGYCREVPDVSASADPSYGYLIYQHSTWQAIGGTSGAAPLWAALFALADSASACSGSALGMVNPALYAIAESNSYSSAFHDVTSGNNDATGENSGLYPAGTGYDMATGLGTPDASNLVPLLCGPYVTSVSPTAANPGTTVTIDGANLGGATAVHFGTTLAASSSIAVNPAGTVLTVTVPTLSGSPTVDITVTSARGTSPSSPTAEFTLDPPTVTSVSPGTGTAGRVVTVTGSGFSQATAVQFGSTAVGAGNFTIVSDTTITATTPAGPAGVVDVTVANAAGTSTASSADHFTYPPVVSALSPTAGASGTTVTVSGAGFTTATAVHVGSTTLSSGAFTIASDGIITLHAPSGPSGTVAVTVTDAGGTSATSSADLFTYGAPVVSAVSPSSGSGGSTVTVSGSGLANATGVQFGSSAVGAGSFTIVSDTTITATAPSGPAGVVDVTVTNAAGTSTASSADQFAYPPLISGLSVQSGPVSGGSTITISGSGFSSIPTSGAVSFGGVGTTYTVVSDSTITAVVPSDSSGTVNVTVTGTGGSSPTTSATQFSFQPAVSPPTTAVPNTTTTPTTIGPVSASVSTFVASPRTVTANGSARALLTVTLHDASGNALADKSVQLRAVTGSSRERSSSAVTNASGQATFTVTDRKAQTVTFEALVSGANVTLGQRAVVSFGAPVSAQRSTFSQVGATRTSCPTGAHATLSVLLRSAAHSPLSGRGVSLSTSRGFKGTVTPTSGTTRANGSLSFSVSDPAKQTVRFTARDAADGVTVRTAVTVRFPAPKHC